MPKVSVIVPIYNQEKYLGYCIESILNQTFIDLEINLVDDGSTDSSKEICKHYVRLDSRIHLVEKENGGLSSARNAGLEVATGEYIGFVDSDGFIKATMYERLLDVMQNMNAGIVSCRYMRATNTLFDIGDEDNGRVILSVYNNISAIQALYDNRLPFVICTSLYVAELFRDIRFRENCVLEDVLILPQLFLEAEKIVGTDYVGYGYRLTDDSIITRGVYYHKFESSLYVFEHNRMFLGFNRKLYLEAEFMKCSSLINWYIKVTESDVSDKKRYFSLIQQEIRKNLWLFLMNEVISNKLKMLLLLAFVDLRFISVYRNLGNYGKGNQS